MMKNYVVFGPTSGRGISKTKALFGILLQYYKVYRQNAVSNITH